MVDPQNMDSALCFDDLVDDAVRPPTSSPRALQFVAEPMPHPFGVLYQWSEYEFDDGGGCLLRKTGQRTFSRGSDQ